MSADRPGEFVDSNVLVYAHSRASAEKRETAGELVDRLWVADGGSLSIQVLQEFFVTVTRKVPQPLSIGEAAEIVEDYSRWTLHSPEPRDLLAAIDIHKRFRISFWDAMVIQSARRLDCRILWTEDLSDGQVYAGVTVRNPFLNMVMEETEDAYERASQRALEDLKNTRRPGARARIPWTRDELHERHPRKKAK